MKNSLGFILIILGLFFAIDKSFAGNMVYTTNGRGFVDKAHIFTNTTLPLDIANQQNEIEDFDDLIKGEASAKNIFGLIEIGSAGIDVAAKKAGITKIYYADSKLKKVCIPFGFIPILVTERKTIVYGE